MPLIQVKLIEGVFNRNQKAEIVKKLTDEWSQLKAKECVP